ncbi:MAG: hypothetical protein AAB956_02220, partial [Patescibacteria group bacterium]
YDKAGNTEDSRDQTFILDTSAPSSQIDQASLTGYKNTNSFSIPTTQSDSASGVAKLHLYFRKDGGIFTEFGNYTVGNVNFTGTGDGEYEFYTRAEDNVGNFEGDISGDTDIRIATTIVDTVNPPAVVITAYNDSGKATVLTNDTWYNHSLPYFEWLTITDDRSGLDQYYYYFGQDNAAILTDTLDKTITDFTPDALTTLSPNGNYYFKIKALDVAGNFSATTTFIYKYDTTAPEFIGSPLVSPQFINADGANSVTFTVHATDAGSGIASITGDLTNIGGGSAVSFTYTSGDEYKLIVTPPGTVTEGTKDVNFTATDNLGNEAFMVLVEVKIDKTAPSAMITNVLPTTIIAGETLNLSYTASDTGGSGVNYVELYTWHGSGSYAKYDGNYTGGSIAFPTTG